MEFGGVIYVTMLDSNKLPNMTIPSFPTVLISQSTFMNNSAFIGGAIYDDNVDYFMVDGSTFIQNVAKYISGISEAGTAGCLYYNCDITVQQCLMVLNNSNNFTQNVAYLQGGALTWDVLEIEFNASDTTFSNNTALLYGDDISAVP